MIFNPLRISVESTKKENTDNGFRELYFHQKKESILENIYSVLAVSGGENSVFQFRSNERKHQGKVAEPFCIQTHSSFSQVFEMSKCFYRCGTKSHSSEITYVNQDRESSNIFCCIRSTKRYSKVPSLPKDNRFCTRAQPWRQSLFHTYFFLVPEFPIRNFFGTEILYRDFWRQCQTLATALITKQNDTSC